MQQTRAQRDMILAEQCVSEVENASEKDSQLRQVYEGLCHSFPVMVRTCGLCQSAAFSAAKGAGDGERAKAHRLLLEHVGRVFAQRGEGSAPAVNALHYIQTADAIDYMLATRRVLAAWVYFKRFAVSILKVEDSGEGKDAGKPE